MAWLIVKNDYQKDTCYNEIGLCVRDTPTLISILIIVWPRVPPVFCLWV